MFAKNVQKEILSTNIFSLKYQKQAKVQSVQFFSIYR